MYAISYTECFYTCTEEKRSTAVMIVEKTVTIQTKKTFYRFKMSPAFNNILKTHVARQQQHFRQFIHTDNIDFVVIIHMMF